VENNKRSIFQRYYAKEGFIDRFQNDPGSAVDVIIPVIHSNELWKSNLYSFYREIPIYRLLIGDGGCIDNTIEVVKEFPRVTIFDHRNITTIGYSERKLIEAVETAWFIHLHSDVFLPDGWFDVMARYQDQYDYYGCAERDTVMVEHESDYEERPWAGAQFVRKACLEAGLSKVEDDYIYRQGDFVYRRMVEEGGFKEGRVRDTFHYHQIMYRKSAWQRIVKSVTIEMKMNRDEEVRTCMTMAKGIVKYLVPPLLVSAVVQNVNRLEELGETDWAEFYSWVQTTNPSWLPHIQQARDVKSRWRSFLDAAKHLIRA
jgi:hypothetical protein